MSNESEDNFLCVVSICLIDETALELGINEAVMHPDGAEMRHCLIEMMELLINDLRVAGVKEPKKVEISKNKYTLSFMN